ncbi:MAG: beta-N-acetylglucosaminidase domain-containing protein [Acidobacteria bacterium]|uniref:Beta-N-acetylglucosaminidase domain-containing protein n=1 Tax=Candidatus Polarisedimenticola svalbardensis TaxID=2886004 RepID=A0A8J7CLM1_9BACT|nr:beta-N-acetylglucosaminidase domain-containing protein [Candidatus Polarisedimenticola svalbardensis]
MSHRPLIRLLLFLALAIVPALAGPVDPFPVRMVKLQGDPAAAATRAHLAYSRSLGFNAVWVYGHQAGVWTDGDIRLNPEFLDLADWCRNQDMTIFVSVNPVAATGGDFIFHEKSGEKRIARFLRKLRRKAGVHDFVLSFDDMPTRLTDLNDFLTYGASTAPAHLDLTRRLYRRMNKSDTFWLAATAYCDAHLGDGNGPYTKPFLERLSTLDPDIGLIWTGPEVLSRSITGDDIRNARRRLGGRKILLYDNYPVNDDGRRLSLGLVLGPLRNRSPEIAGHVAAYLACPMNQVGASRLPLRTVAEYLADPAGYDPDLSWQGAIADLAGDDPAALDALKTQAMEWGGWIGGRNYHHADESSIFTAARELAHPAYVARWGYTLKRYPDRIAALSKLSDTWFRDDLLLAMKRRLAVARVFPLIVEYRARKAAGRKDADDILRTILTVRERTAERPVRLLLESFLEEAGVPSEAE